MEITYIDSLMKTGEKIATILDTKKVGAYLMTYLTSYISLLIAPSLNTFPMSILYKKRGHGEAGISCKFW